MAGLKTELEKKSKKLEELKNRRSKSFCVDIHTSTSYMKFEMEIEELEDEIADLKKKFSNAEVR